MSAARQHACRAVIAHARRLQAEGLVHATAGNVSARVTGDPDTFVLTPTGIAYEDLEPGDVSVIGPGGELLAGRSPSSELPLHARLYARRPEVGAVIHTHSPSAMTLAVLGWRLPAILTGLVEATGGEVRVAAYARPGSEALALAAEEGLRDRGACLLAHHGLIAVGADLGRALRAASVTEATARVYLDARAHASAVPSLPDAEVAAIARSWRAQWMAEPSTAIAP
ncbi:MAG TPA: class II aldolase/adducin family protein [Solirubrobacteraceae bacterium]|nr:class II aldolase/adducin family protein [Solirubrobacteraceae bacterium]